MPSMLFGLTIFVMDSSFLFRQTSSFVLGEGDWIPLFITTMVGVAVCQCCIGADEDVTEAGEIEEVTNCGEFSSPVVDNEFVGEKTCGGGSSLLCLILH